MTILDAIFTKANLTGLGVCLIGNANGITIEALYDSVSTIPAVKAVRALLPAERCIVPVLTPPKAVLAFDWQHMLWALEA